MLQQPSSRLFGLLHGQARQRGDARTMKFIEAESHRIGIAEPVLAYSAGYAEGKLAAVFADVSEESLAEDCSAQHYYAPSGMPALWQPGLASGGLGARIPWSNLLFH